jgi:hypothetical protein
MTRIDIDGLRQRWEGMLKEHSKGGVRPPLATLHAEEQALYEFARGGASCWTR